MKHMKRMLLGFLLTMMIAPGASAQIFYHDINPDTTITIWDAFTIPFAASPLTDLLIWHHPTPDVVVQTHGNCQVLFDGGGIPSKLESGNAIGASGNWMDGNYDPLNNTTAGNWQSNASGKYLGFRFKSGSATWKYGWLKLSVATGATGFTVHEWAYNTQGDPITAGQGVPTSVSHVTSNDDIGLVFSGKTVRFTHLAPAAQYPVCITDMNGRTIRQLQITSNEGIDLSDLSMGAYVVRLKDGAIAHHYKIGLR